MFSGCDRITGNPHQRGFETAAANAEFRLIILALMQMYNEFSNSIPALWNNACMIIADLDQIPRRTYPARRRTQNLVGGASPIQAAAFSMGHVTLEPSGGQVPWHNQEQEEIYMILEGTAEMCLGEERQILHHGQAVYIPPRVFHQLTNISEAPCRMIYCYGPAGDVAHWRQELEGSLPRAGTDAPPLPQGSSAQFTDKPKS